MSRITLTTEQSKADFDCSVLILALVAHLGDATDLPNFWKDFPNCEKEKSSSGTLSEHSAHLL